MLRTQRLSSRMNARNALLTEGFRSCLCPWKPTSNPQPPPPPRTGLGTGRGLATPGCVPPSAPGHPRRHRLRHCHPGWAAPSPPAVVRNRLTCERTDDQVARAQLGEEARHGGGVEGRATLEREHGREEQWCKHGHSGCREMLGWIGGRHERLPPVQMPVLSRRVRAVGLISSSVCAVFVSVACGPATPPVARSSGQATPDTTIPSGPYGDAARRGRALLTATRDSLPAHVGNKLRCTSCHLDAGRRETAGSWLGAFARYPQYRARSGVVETIEYRVNDCFRRSMNGTPLDPGGGDMRDIVAYLAFLSRGIVVSPVPANSRLQKWAAFKADTAAGARVFTATCAKCH